MNSTVSIKKIDYLHQATSIQNDNIDVTITLSSGEVITATFFTLTNIATLMSSYKKNGECLNGSYFWTKNMIIVCDLSKETIQNVVTDLIATKEYLSFLALDINHN